MKGGGVGGHVETTPNQPNKGRPSHDVVTIITEHSFFFHPSSCSLMRHIKGITGGQGHNITRVWHIQSDIISINMYATLHGKDALQEHRIEGPVQKSISCEIGYTHLMHFLLIRFLIVCLNVFESLNRELLRHKFFLLNP